MILFSCSSYVCMGFVKKPYRQLLLKPLQSVSDIVHHVAILQIKSPKECEHSLAPWRKGGG